MHGLFYPGVLGSLIYAFPDNILSHRAEFSVAGTVLAVSLFVSFAFDYVYSSTKDAKQTYSYGTFIADCFIVVLMFIAGQKILGTPLFQGIDEFWFLGAARLFAWAWEFLRVQESPDPALERDPAKVKQEEIERNADLTAQGIDFLFVPAYPIVGLIAECTPWYPWALAALLVFDALMYIGHPRLANWIYRQRMTAAGTSGQPR